MSYPLTRSQFASLVSPMLLSRMQQCLDDTLTKPHLVQHVLLVGGGSRMPFAVEICDRAVKNLKVKQTILNGVLQCKEPENVVTTGVNYFISKS